MSVALDRHSLRRRLVPWGIAYALAVLPCLLTAGAGRGVLLGPVLGLGAILAVVAVVFSLRMGARWMVAAAVVAALAIFAALLSVLAWTPEESGGLWIWAWLTALAGLGLAVGVLEFARFVMQGLLGDAPGPSWGRGPEVATWLTVRRIASWGAMIGGLGLFVLLLRLDYRHRASSDYWGAGDSGFLGLPPLLWPEVPLLFGLTLLIGGTIGGLAGGVAWAALKGLLGLVGDGQESPDEPQSPAA